MTNEQRKKLSAADMETLLEISNNVQATIETLAEIGQVREMLEFVASDKYEESETTISLKLTERHREGMSMITDHEVYLNLDARTIEGILAQLDEDERDCKETFEEIKQAIQERDGNSIK